MLASEAKTLLLEGLKLCENKISGGCTKISFAMSEGADADNAGLNDTDEYGQTVLIKAARHEKKHVVEALLSIEGIDINIRDNDGRSALSYCKDEEIKAILKEHGATE